MKTPARGAKSEKKVEKSLKGAGKKAKHVSQ